jgi:hypothetical protein
MSNFENETIELINTLPAEIREQLIERIEWEKEMSWSDGYADAVIEWEKEMFWSDGYADAVDQLDNKQ